MIFHCAFPIADALHSFAAAWLARPVESAGATVSADGAQVTRIYLDGTYQIERCVVPAHFVIPQHTHPDADTIEVMQAGMLRLSVNGDDPFKRVKDSHMPRFTRGRGIRINAADLHGGFALHEGATFLSIQRWRGKPTSVLTSYVGAPLGPEHRGLM